MRILCLYNNEIAIELFNWLKTSGHEVVLCNTPISLEWCQKNKFDLAISYTYRTVLSGEIISTLGNAVNIHTSFLPWNRGASPNLWSIIDDTKKGVTLHYINEGLDKGDIIAQAEIEFTDEDTLKSSYLKLDRAAKDLFKKAFSDYDSWREKSIKPREAGSYHSVKDSRFLIDMIDTYDIKIKDFKEKYNDLYKG